MRLPTLLLVALLAGPASAEITLPSFFGDQMVLQREANVPIWGTATAGQKVSVSFVDKTLETTADDNGVWRLELAALAASKQPRTLTVRCGNDETKIANVLVGDVWLGSGQSNMAGRVASYAKNDQTLAALVAKAPYPHMRLMQSGPQPGWTAASETTVPTFSAIHFAFGERLQRELDVPIGLIVGAVGGTPSGFWIPPDTYATSKKCQAAVSEFNQTYDHEKALQQYRAKLSNWEKQAADAKAAGKKLRGRKPSPPAAPGESSRGGKIGGLYQRFIQPIAGYRIRGVLWDQGEARSGVVGVDQHTMMSELIRGWREAWGQGDFPFLFVQKPSGGGCAFSNEDPITRDGDPFVSKLPGIARLGSAEQRFLYVRLMHDNANAWMVPASDLGSGIHPRNKWGYGNRAAEVALSQVYKTGIQAYGPIYRSHTIDGNKVTIQFDQVGKGLTVAHGENLQGFALAGDDGNWHWADAQIKGDTVVASSQAVPQPTKVRYAYAAKRAWANLFNQNGLPALAFDASQ